MKLQNVLTELYKPRLQVLHDLLRNGIMDFLIAEDD